MTFNVETFRVRTISAIIFALVMLGGLLLNQWAFFLLCSIIHFGCWFEYQSLVGKIDKGYQEITAVHKYGVTLAGWCLLLYFTNDTFDLFGFRLHEFGWWLGLVFIFILPITELLFTRNISLKNISHSIFGLIYISLSLGLLMDLYNPALLQLKSSTYSASANFFPLVIVLSLWINDTMAYLVGSWIGTHQLSAISPKKTWEGTVGGILLCVASAALLSYFVLDLGWLSLHITIIAAIAAIAGTFGDLLESKLKRLANVKDSGSFLPGHGGFLDRFDSMLVAVPFVWVYVKLFLK
jgi:phosphatidate cytidylyltransferase